MPRYEDIRNTVEPMVLTTGTPEDRLLGLELLLALARSRTVLDIGCHVGVVAEAFGRRCARLVHGVDFYQPGLQEARARFQSQAYDTHARFEWCDLSRGMPAIRDALPGLLPAYDIVLYLGMHHHLVRQMTPASLDEMLADLQSLTRGYFAVRTTLEWLIALHSGLSDRGFILWSEHDPTPRPVTPLRIYRKQ